MDENSKRRILTFSFLLGALGFALTFYWYDWKLALILFILTWANNIDVRMRTMYSE